MVRSMLGAAFVGLVSGLVMAGSAASTSPSPSPSPIPQGCQLRAPQPEAPLKLNVIAVKNLAKAIAMGKEVFNCYDAQSTLAQVKDVETFVELTESGVVGKEPGFTALAKAVVVDTCVKDLKTGAIDCKSTDVPLGTTHAPVSKCTVTKGTYPFPTIEQPTHPVEMSTVVLENGLVKTIKAEEEVFDCAGQIGDLYLFTDVGEVAEKSGFAAVGTSFEGVLCLKDEPTAAVVSCKLFTPGHAG